MVAYFFIFGGKIMIIDISQELFSCNTFPGDPVPEKNNMMSIKQGDICNLTSFSMCAHNGTHVDAPYHFLDDGKRIDEISMDSFVGDCYVAHHTGDLSAGDACNILDKAKNAGAGQRILIGGDMTVTAEAARVFAKEGIKLIGNESQTIGPENAPMEVHLILLGAEVVLLEGIVLKDVPEGKYFLSATPINLGGCDGAPCRAVLIK